MADAELAKTTITVSTPTEYVFEGKGEVVTFDGFLKVYGRLKESELPDLQTGDTVEAKTIIAHQTYSKPPARYTEGSLVKELEKNDKIQSIVTVTAQHREMLDQVLKIFDIVPDYDLNIMKQGQTLADITTRALNGLDDVIKEAKPDIILVHGDTSTTFAGALAAFYNQVKIGHVEAGLRTYDKYSPYPEEMNRKLTGAMTDLHFSPTISNKNNLLKENIDDKEIYITGNTVIDALKTTVRDDYKFAERFIPRLKKKNV
jgi:UDP-N-acetylglucosamine 2-epimerase (non-hydrolysing)